MKPAASKRQRHVALVVLVVVSVALSAVAFTGTAGAASEASLRARPSDPGATSSHTVTLTVDQQDSWNGISVDYSGTDASVADVGPENVWKIGIDRGNDDPGTDTDVNVSDDVTGVSASNNGHTLTISLGGSYTVNASDELVLRVKNVVNPSTAGTYDVGLDFNPQSSGGEATAELLVAATDRARVSFADQTAAVDGSTPAVTVQKAVLPDGGYVVVHATQDGAPGPVVGHSDYLGEGKHTGVQLRVDRDATQVAGQTETLVAMAHRDTNGNRAYDFPDADGPYTVNGDPVIDDASVRYPTSGEPGGNQTTTSTSETTAPGTTTTAPTTTTESGGTPGFTVGVALAALLAAAALLARRD